VYLKITFPTLPRETEMRHTEVENYSSYSLCPTHCRNLKRFPLEFESHLDIPLEEEVNGRLQALTSLCNERIS
jgi:hypothetical protein